TLKRTGPVLEEPSSKRKKTTKAPIPSVSDIPQSPVVFSPQSSGTRRKSLGRNRLPRPKSKLQELDLEADDQTFIKLVSDEDSEDEAPRLWSALVVYMFADVPYPLSIDKDVVGNDMTTAEQLIQFIKNQLAVAQVSSA
nr:hypothetical protein [Tanacetum cinerariifolium]